MAEKTTYVIALNDKLSPGLKKATAKALGLDKAMGRTGDKGARKMGGLTRSIRGLAGPLLAAGAAMKAFQFSSESIQAARNFESLTNAINFTSGSIEEGGKTMDFLRQRSELLGTDLLVSVEGFKTLSTAMLGTKLEGKATRDIFDGIQTATTAMGLSADNSKGAIIAIGQMMSKGKVSAEELTQQLNERLPGSLGAAARAVGVTTKELFKMMEQGQLMSEDFLPKFSDELKKTFGKALPTAAESAQAQFNRFNNTMLELKLVLGRTLMPVINRLMSGFKSVVGFLKSNKDVIIDAFRPLIEHGRATIKMFSSLKDQIGFTGSASDIFATGLSVIKRGLQFLQPVLKGARDITFSIWTQIIKVTKAFNGLAVKFPVIGKTFFGLVSMIREGLLIIKDRTINILGGVGDLLAGIFSGNLDQIKEGLKGLRKEMSPANVFQDSKRMAKAFSAGFNSEIGLDAVTLAGAGGKKDRSFADVLKNSTTGGTGAGSAAGVAGGTAAKKSSSLTGVKGGRPTNVNITIGKLIETFNITTTNMQDTTNQLKDKISQVLLSSVNNVNNIAQ